MLALAAGIAFGALLRWTSMTLASQGRLLFPTIAGISTLLALGLLTLGQRLRLTMRMQRMGAALLAAASAVLTLAAPFVYLRPAYALPAQLPGNAELRMDQLTELRFSDEIRWMGYRVDTPAQRVVPGELLEVTLYWQALKAQTRDYSIFIKLFTPDQRELVSIDTYPGGGTFQTTRWTPGNIVADRYRIRMPESFTGTQPVLLLLDVGLFEYAASPGQSRMLDTFDGAGLPTGRQRYALASFGRRVSAAPAPQPPQVAQANVTAAARVIDARTVALDLRWQVLSTVNGDYTVFAQLADAQGIALGNGDGQGDFPPRWWRAGDIVTDTRTIALAHPLAPGQPYVIRYGLYRQLVDGRFERMPAVLENGARAEDDILTVHFETPAQFAP
jgi:hypothetical protein